MSDSTNVTATSAHEPVAHRGPSLSQLVDAFTEEVAGLLVPESAGQLAQLTAELEGQIAAEVESRLLSARRQAHAAALRGGDRWAVEAALAGALVGLFLEQSI